MPFGGCPLVDDRCVNGKLRGLVCLFALCACPVVYGQSAVLAKVDVRGAERMSAERVVEASGLKMGQAVDKTVMQAAVERMMATGFFERVNWRSQPAEDGWTVTLTVREAAEREAEAVEQAVGRIQRVEIRGVAAERANRVKAVLEGSMVGREFRMDAVEEVGGPLVRAALTESGHWDAAARFKEEAGQRLVVEIEMGPVTVVGEVAIEGGEAKWIENAGYVKGEAAESRKLNRAMGKVIEAARNEGFLMASARSTNVLRDGRLDVALSMDKGPLFRFGELKIEGLSAQGETRARKLWQLKAGEAASAAALEEWIRRVFEQRIPAWDGVQREWRPRQGEAVADAVVSFR